MPPQVTKTGPGPAVQQVPPPEIPKDESKEVAKSTSSSDTSAAKTQTSESKAGTTTQQKKQPEDPKAAARSAQASKHIADSKRSHDNERAQMWQKNLQKQVSAAKTGTAYTAADLASDVTKAGVSASANASANPSRADASGLKKGESISAKVTHKNDGIHFEFERPITKDQAGAIIFQDGKVPQNAKLEGSDKNWVVKTPNDPEDRAKTVAHFNKRTETIKIPERNPNAAYQPATEVKNTWVGGDLKTPGPRTPAPERRLDLKNDMGFTINNTYRLDEGQRHREKLGNNGRGYEVGFEKPMTKDQVMNKLFDKEKLDNTSEIRLLPKSKEPAAEWKVELIGNANAAFKTEPGRAYSDVDRAFLDANRHGNESLPSDTPAGVRNVILSRMVPKDAANPKPGVYVWEQDGHMVYVKTNNKGKDGYYEPQVTKMPTEKQGQKWMREYMKEKGMEPREAWQTFWQDTADLSKGGIGIVGGARAPVSGSARVQTGRVSSGRTARVNMPKGSSMPEAPAVSQQRAASQPQQARPREQWQTVNLANKQPAQAARTETPVESPQYEGPTIRPLGPGEAAPQGVPSLTRQEAAMIANLRAGNDVIVRDVKTARKLLKNMPDIRPHTATGNDPHETAPKGTYRGDLRNIKNAKGPIHAPGTAPRSHVENEHYNIQFPNGKKATIIISLR